MLNLKRLTTLCGDWKKVKNSIAKLSENLRQYTNGVQINQKDTNEIIVEGKRRTDVRF